MNHSELRTNPLDGSAENAKGTMPIWLEEEIEELQHETQWEIFSTEIDNWAAMNVSSSEL